MTLRNILSAVRSLPDSGLAVQLLAEFTSVLTNLAEGNKLNAESAQAILDNVDAIHRLARGPHSAFTLMRAMHLLERILDQPDGFARLEALADKLDPHDSR